MASSVKAETLAPTTAMCDILLLIAGREIGGDQYFDIDMLTGEMMVLQELDREVQAQYDVTVRVHSSNSFNNSSKYVKQQNTKQQNAERQNETDKTHIPVLHFVAHYMYVTHNHR